MQAQAGGEQAGTFTCVHYIKAFYGPRSSPVLSLAPPSIISLCCVASGVPMELILKEGEGACKPCSRVSLSLPTSCARGTPVAALVARSPPAPNSSSPRGMPSPSPKEGEEEKEDPSLAPGPTGMGL